jgi:hypothetical protein
MPDEYSPRYQWRETWPGETGLDRKPQQDFCGRDGEMAVGRIIYERSGPKEGQWQWAGGHAAWMKTIVYPQSGWAKTAREAARMVEEQYDNLKVRNGIAA